MSAKTHDSAVAVPKRKSTKRGTSAKKISTLDQPGSDRPTAGKKRKHRDGAPFNQSVPVPLEEPAREGEVRRTRCYYLARASVVLGPYTAFQMLESIRLGIFESHDLAWTEESNEWREVCRLLPVDKLPQTLPLVAPQTVKNGEEWPDVAALPPIVSATVAKLPGRRLRMPLTEQQLREHEALFAHSPLHAFLEALTRWSFAQALSDLQTQIVKAWKHWHRVALARCTHPSSRLMATQERASC